MPLNVRFLVPRPTGSSHPLFLRRNLPASTVRRRPFSSTGARAGILGLERDPTQWWSAPTYKEKDIERKLKAKNAFTVYPQPPRAYPKVCPEPLKTVNAQQLAVLDPTGARTRLFDPYNLEGAKVGDILLVRTKEGEPFAGVCLNIRRRGPDTSILLRGNLTRLGVEMWYKVYSPLVEGIEIVQRRAKRARRARLYYMRKPKHDIGSVENIVRQYLRQRQSLRTADASKGRDANSNRRHSKKNKTTK